MMAPKAVWLAAISAAWLSFDAALIQSRAAEAAVLPLDGHAHTEAIERSRAAAGSPYREFRIAAGAGPISRQATTDGWADKLAAIGLLPAAGAAGRGAERVLGTYGGADGKLAGPWTEAGASGAGYLLPRCGSWACGEILKAIPGVAFPLAFAGIALVVLSRVRRKRGPLEPGSAKAAP